MRDTAVSRLVPLAVAAGALLLSACSGLQVEMTSTPDQVHNGQPVTFDIKLTNRSQCPIAETGAELIAFIPADHFVQKLLGPELPPNPPPEIVMFLDDLSAFFDDLCTGGTPDLPTFPMTGPASCSRSGGDALCEFSGPLTGHDGNSGSMTFSGLGDRLQCELDSGIMSCQLRFSIQTADAKAGGTGAALPTQLNCLSAADLGVIGINSTESAALCFIGTIPNIGGLGAGEMATGQVSLPARGSGFVRNIVFGFSFNGSDPGVCKGGASSGQPCSTSDTDPCPGSTCGKGICVMGGNAGRGCDAATAVADCPGGSCELCEDVPTTGFLPIDCTTTYIAPEGVPAMSHWGLIGLTLLLVGFGTLLLQRRTRRA